MTVSAANDDDDSVVFSSGKMCIRDSTTGECLTGSKCNKIEQMHNRQLRSAFRKQRSDIYRPRRRMQMCIRDRYSADEGDIVVALVDNETTLKRFYRDKKHRCCRLHPENSKMKDIYVQDCTIQGVAQNVIKAL